MFTKLFFLCSKFKVYTKTEKCQTIELNWWCDCTKREKNSICVILKAYAFPMGFLFTFSSNVFRFRAAVFYQFLTKIALMKSLQCLFTFFEWKREETYVSMWLSRFDFILSMEFFFLLAFSVCSSLAYHGH